jgi:flagellar FliL protein
VAEDNAAKEAAPVAAPVQGAGGGKSPILLIALAVINMLVVAGVGFMLFKGKQKEAAEPKIEHVIKGEHEAQEKEAHEEKAFIGKVIPLETFIVNLSGSKGRRIAKVNMELELQGDQVQVEIDKRKAQIRDIIIILLSSKTYDEVATREGKDGLKNEIKDTLNAFLTKGKILNVYFTEFIYN